jgi:two-component system response regulator DesR
MMSRASPASDNDRPVRVLLVDDSARVRHELRQLLELSGRVRILGEAGDGSEAIRLAAELAPDVVVMDLEMPGMDGFEATRQVKALQPAPRVIILSVHAGPATEAYAREAGADKFVTKGADYRILLNAIRGMDGSNQSFVKGEES